VDVVGKLCTALGIPGGFTSYGLAPQHFNFIVKNCRSNSMRNNPRPMSDNDVISMLEELL
jgi:alcohol dehydrogenase class IV